MLSFIQEAFCNSAATCHLNTSHVIFYPSDMDKDRIFVKNLNTSHVIFYPTVGNTMEAVAAFKYISCYLLSNGFKPFFNYHPSQIPLFFKVSAIFYHPQAIFSNLF